MTVDEAAHLRLVAESLVEERGIEAHDVEIEVHRLIRGKAQRRERERQRSGQRHLAAAERRARVREHERTPLQPEFAEHRSDGNSVRAHAGRVEARQKRGRVVRARDVQRRFERAADRYADACDVVYQLGEMIRRRVHPEVERIVASEAESAHRRGGNLGRRQLRPIDDDATSRGVKRDVRAVERERPERAVVERRIRADVEQREASADGRVT